MWISSIWFTGATGAVLRSVAALALVVVLGISFVTWFRESQRDPEPLVEPGARPSSSRFPVLTLAFVPVALCGLGLVVRETSDGILWGRVAMTVIVLLIGVALLWGRRLQRRMMAEVHADSERIRSDSKR